MLKRQEKGREMGVPLDAFSEESEKELTRRALGVSENEKMLLSVGELIPRKNHESVIRAIAELGHPNIKYFICGTGQLQEYLQKLINELGLAENVRLLGYRTDIPELCRSADLFVFPSIQEGLPVALMEAIASKTPVICSDIRGNTDLMKCGALFDAKDIDGISGKITEYLSSNKSEEIESNYRNLEKYAVDNVVNEMSLLYFGGNKA